MRSTSDFAGTGAVGGGIDGMSVRRSNVRRHSLLYNIPTYYFSKRLNDYEQHDNEDRTLREAPTDITVKL
jgi:hypothetical protein